MLRWYAFGDQQFHHGDGARRRQLPVGRERARTLDRLPIGGFTGYVRLLPKGMQPSLPEPKPQRPSQQPDGEEEDFEE